MKILSILRRHLTYANVAATLAVVLALSGTAYAALAKNSVTSATIKNGQVKSADLKNAGVKATDLAAAAVTSDKIADGAATGADIDEGTLATVPNAAALGGLPATSFPRTTPSVAGGYFEPGPLQLLVPGYGSFRATCNDNGTAGVASDDLVSFATFPDLGSNPFSAMRSTKSPAPGSDAVVNMYNMDSVNGPISPEDDRMFVDQYLRSADGSRAIRVWMWGFDDPTTTGCYAVLEAQILR